MPAINLRNVSAELRAKLKYEASLLGLGLEAYCVEILKARLGSIEPKAMQEITNTAMAVLRDREAEKKNRGVPVAAPRTMKGAVKLVQDLQEAEAQVDRVFPGSGEIPAKVPEFGVMYNCHIHGAQAGDHCPKCVVKAFIPASWKVPAEQTGNAVYPDKMSSDEINAHLASLANDQKIDELNKSIDLSEAIAECPDCRAAKVHAYSDATTPGFFYDTCERHRRPGIQGAAGVVIEKEMTVEEAKKNWPGLDLGPVHEITPEEARQIGKTRFPGTPVPDDFIMGRAMGCSPGGGPGREITINRQQIVGSHSAVTFPAREVPVGPVELENTLYPGMSGEISPEDAKRLGPYKPSPQTHNCGDELAKEWDKANPLTATCIHSIPIGQDCGDCARRWGTKAEYLSEGCAKCKKPRAEHFWDHNNNRWLCAGNVEEFAPYTDKDAAKDAAEIFRYIYTGGIDPQTPEEAEAGRANEGTTATGGSQSAAGSSQGNNPERAPKSIQSRNKKGVKAPVSDGPARPSKRRTDAPQAIGKAVQSKEDVKSVISAMAPRHDKAACRNKYCLICHPGGK